MSYPRLRRYVTAGDLDCDGNPIACGRQYDLEWLRPQFVQGGDFESGIPADLFQLTITGTASAEVSSTEHYEGAHSLYVDIDAAATLVLASRVYASLLRSRTYFCDVAYRAVAGQRIAFALTVWYYDSEMNYISAQATSINYTGTIWDTATMTLAPPSNARYAVVAIAKTAAGAVEGYIDRLRLWPSLAAGTGGNIGVGDDPGFAALLAGDMEMFEFPCYPSISTSGTQDDPVSRVEIGGDIRERLTRPVKWTRALAFPYLLRGYVEELRLWHQKTRGVALEFRDEWGDSRYVRWVGGFTPVSWPNPEIQGVTLTLVDDSPWL